jgi:hypothetical protein
LLFTKQKNIEDGKEKKVIQRTESVNSKKQKKNMDVVDFTGDQKALLAAVHLDDKELNGGVIVHHKDFWYFHEHEDLVRGVLVKRVRDFGGVYQKGEPREETCLRWLQAHGGIEIDDITAILGVFVRERSFCVILVETDKEPVAMVPGGKIVRMKHYIPNNYVMNPRLYIRDLEKTMRGIELDDTVTNLTSSMPHL